MDKSGYSLMILMNTAMKIATQTKIAMPARSVRLMLKTPAGSEPPVAPCRMSSN